MTGGGRPTRIAAGVVLALLALAGAYVGEWAADLAARPSADTTAVGLGAGAAGALVAIGVALAAHALMRPRRWMAGAVGAVGLVVFVGAPLVFLVIAYLPNAR